MGLFGFLSANPQRELRRAEDHFRVGKNTQAIKATDRAIDVLQRSARKGDARAKSHLADAWFLKGRICLGAGDRDGAFHAFFACLDRVRTDNDSRAFVVEDGLKLKEPPVELYPVFVDYVVDAKGATGQAYKANVSAIRRLLRPRPEKAGSVESVESWNAALADRVKNLAWCRFHLGIIAASRGNWKQAHATAGAAVALDRDDEAAARLLAFATLQLEGPKAALEILRSRDIARVRGTLILRAYLEQADGNWTNAASCYQAAEAIRELQGDHAIAFAEALVRTGMAAEARKVLARCKSFSPPGRIVQALALGDEGPVAEARTALAEAMRDASVRDEACRAALAIVSKDPARDEALPTLALVPSAQRDDRFFLLEGLCHALRSRANDAHESWSHVGRDSDALLAVQQLVRLNGLIARYNDGDFIGVVTAWCDDPPAESLAGQADDLCRFALARILLRTKGGSLPPETLSGLSALADWSTRLRELAFAPELLGAIFAASGESRQAFDMLALARRPDAALVSAAAALRSGNVSSAVDLLQRYEGTDARKERLLAAAAAMRGDWDRALAIITPDDPPHLRAGLYFLAERWGDLEAIESDGGAASYFKSVGMLRTGHQQAAETELGRVRAIDAFRPAADQLLAWIDIHAAATALRARDFVEARTRLLAGMRRAPEGAMALLDTREAPLAILLQANDRTSIRETFSRTLPPVEALDPKNCHRLAIFHLVEGEAAFIRGDFKAAIMGWEAATGCLAVVLASSAYMAEWRAGRAAAYRIELPDVDFPAVVREFCGALFETGATRLSGEGEAASAARILTDVLEAELHAAGLLATVGGFRSDDVTRPLVFGPTALSFSALANQFGEFCLDLASEQERPLTATLSGDGTTIDLDAMAGRMAVPVREIEQFFSCLRLPAFLMRKGDLDRARALLADASPVCFPLCKLEHCSSGPTKGCSGRGVQFFGCNPAFAREDGTQHLQRAARNLQLDLSLKVADRDIAEKDPNLEGLKQLWSEAVELGEACGRSSEVKEKIRSVVLGRVSALYKGDRLDVALELVNAAHSVCHDEDLVAERARLMTDRAIDAANKNSDYATAVDMLREACRVNPQQSRPKENLVVALQLLASKTTDIQQVRKVLQEASDVATEWLAMDTHNPRAQNLLADVCRDILVWYRGRISELSNDPTKETKYLEDALEIGAGCLRKTGPYGEAQQWVAQVVASIAANVGVDLALAKVNYRRAVNLLRAARMIDVTSKYATRNLMNLLHDQGAKLFETNTTLAGDLMQEAVIVGNAWMASHSDDTEIANILSAVSRDYDVVARRYPSVRSQSVWNDPRVREAHMNPHAEGGLELLAENPR